MPAKVLTSPAVTSPAVDPGDQAAVWSALMERVGDQRTLLWIRSFEVIAWGKGHVTVTPKPGRREVAGFATPQRLALLEAELEAVVGQPMRVTVENPPATSAPVMPSGRTDDAQRKALDLPLVRRIVEVFPDVTIVGVEQVDENSPTA